MVNTCKTTVTGLINELSFSRDAGAMRGRGKRELRASRLGLPVAVLILLLSAAGLAAQETDPPAIQVSESGSTLMDGSLFNRPVNPVVDVTDASTFTASAELDGLPFVSATDVSGEGSHELSVTAEDEHGNGSALTVQFEIDTTAPVILSIQPPNGTLVATSEVTIQGEVVGATEATVNGQTASFSGSTFSAGPFALAEGSNAFTVIATDAAGNGSQQTVSIERDSSAPTVVITQPGMGSVVGSTAVDVAGSASDPHLATVTVNGVAASQTGGTFLAPQVPLAEGENTLVATATDTAGNSGDASVTVVLDSEAPMVAITDPAAGTVVPDATIIVSGTATDPHLDRVDVDGIPAVLVGESWSVEVALAEGVNDLLATAVDVVGHSTEASVSVVRDSRAPSIEIELPDDGAYLAVDQVDVSGMVEDEPGVTVTVNGIEAAVTGGTFSAAAIPLVEGENRLIARATDVVGNSGARTRVVNRDTIAPGLMSVDPGDGALAIPLDSRFRLVLSEDLQSGAAGGFILRTAGGAALLADVTIAGATTTMTPQSSLPPETAIELELSTVITDRAGNSLEESLVLDFVTADTTAPAPPGLDAIPTSPLCAPSLSLSGTAEADSVIRVTGGAAGAQTRADGSGVWSLSVELLAGSLNRLEIVAKDAGGNASSPLVLELVQDCQGPVVLSSTLVSSDEVEIVFDEALSGASVIGIGAVTVTDAGGPVAGVVSLDPGGLVATFLADSPFPGGALRLDVTQVVTDIAGNALAYPYSRVFGGAETSSFLTGRVLSAESGRPLEGSLVVVLSTDGVPNSLPEPQQLTGELGRFQIPVNPGTHYLAAARFGHTPVFRMVVSAAGEGSDVFDPRLTPLAEGQSVGSGGGSVAGNGGSVLELPPGALTADTTASVTTLEEQGLPALLPYGWSPRGAVWVDLDGAAIGASGALTLPVDAVDGSSLELAELDQTSLQWTALGSSVVADGAVTIPVTHETGYVAVEADGGPLAPPVPVAGNPLGSSPTPVGGEVSAATVTFDPEMVLPSQRSVTTVGYTLASDVASGVPLTVTVREELTLLDGSVRREPPYEADLVLYHSTLGEPRSRFGLKPSETAQSVPLSLGAEDVVVRTHAGDTVVGNVLGPVGGVVTSEDGDVIDVPAGALSEPTAVVLTRRDASALSVPVPSGTELIGLLELDLGGQVLAVPAALTWNLGSQPGAGERALLFQQVDIAGAGQVLRVVGDLQSTSTGWQTSSIDPQDLPWPGARTEGLFVFLRVNQDVGFYRGTVFDIFGNPLSGALVGSETLPWIQLGNADGSYVVPGWLGPQTLFAENLLTGNLGVGGAILSTAQERVDLDIHLQVTGPAVVEVSPADGASSVTPGIEPTIRFSEAVDPASVPIGVRLFDGALEIAVTHQTSGNLVTVIPRATLTPGTAYELRIGTGVTDLSGYQLAQTVVSTFTTLEQLQHDDLDPTRIHLVEPDGGGNALVLGQSGAVPAGTLVFVENTTSFVATSSVTADGDGSFDLSIEATLLDTLLLHVVIEGSNEIVVELTPFKSADLRSAYVGGEAVEFTTGDGISVSVEKGTFSGPAVVTVTPEPLVSPAPVPPELPIVHAFSLDFGGAEAAKPLQISFPVPAGATGEEFLLSRIVTVWGKPYWMVHDLMRRDGESLTTKPRELPLTRRSISSEVKNEDPFMAFRMAARESGEPLLLPRDGTRFDVAKAYVPGAAVPGRYLVQQNTTFLDFVAFPFQAGQYAAYLNTALDGLVAAINAGIERFLSYAAILFPVRRGQEYTVESRDLTTGYKLFEGTFDPPPEGEIVLLPEDIFGDYEWPYPVAGSPVRFIPLELGGSMDTALDVGLRLELEPDAEGENGALAVTGDAGAADGEVSVILFGLAEEDPLEIHTVTGADGSFLLTGTVPVGERFVLVVGARIAPDEPLEIAFSEALADEFPGIDVLGENGQSLAPLKDAVGTTAHVRISPRVTWPAGEYVSLVLRSGLEDSVGNTWDRVLEIDLAVEGSEMVDTLLLTQVLDVARLGSWLFLAAGEAGLAVVDASDPSALAHVVDGGITFPFPYDDPVRGVTVDPHGRVLVVGGGVTGPGQLKIFDPLALDPAAVAANSSDPAVRYAAFKGSTIISDKLGADGTSLPEGTPQRVAVLSNDHTDRWRIGIDDPPAGVVLDPESPPDGVWEYTVTVSGSNGTAGLPVTLRDLSLGRWRRVDASTDAGSEGSWEVQLPVVVGDRLELVRNVESIAYVATLGAGFQVVDVNAFYNEDPDDPGPESDLIGGYTGYGDPGFKICDEPVSDISGALLDVGTLLDHKHPDLMTVVGLVAVKGLLVVESDPKKVGDVGAMGFVSQECAEADGSRLVSGMDIVEDYPLDANGDGTVEIADYIVVSHRTAGLLIYDAKDRSELDLVGRVEMPGSAAAVSVDRQNRRIYVSGYGGGLWVVDFSSLPFKGFLDENHDGNDDRIIETIALPGNTNQPAFVHPELGIAYAGGADRGLTSVRIGAPMLSAVADRSSADSTVSRWRSLDRLAPLGVPTVEEGEDGERSAYFRVLGALPGAVGSETHLDVVSLGPGGAQALGAGDVADLPGRHSTVRSMASSSPVSRTTPGRKRTTCFFPSPW